MKAWLAAVPLIALSLGTSLAADNRFPQPVRVGALIGQRLIAPREAQPLLGTIEAVARSADGALSFRIKTASMLPWGGRSVSVPASAISYLGPQLALTGLSEAQLDALPAAAPSAALPADEIVRVDLVKPFH